MTMFSLLVIGLEEIVIVSHAMHQVVPVLRCQRRHEESLAGRVESVPSRRVYGVPVGLLQVHDPSLVIQHRPRCATIVAVHMVNPVAGIQSVVGRDRWADVGDARRSPSVHLIIKHFVFVKVRVAEKLPSNRRFVSEGVKNRF